jgi:hypothetical protein
MITFRTETAAAEAAGIAAAPVIALETAAMKTPATVETTAAAGMEGLGQ